MPFEYHKGSNLPFDTALFSPPDELLFFVCRVIINRCCDCHTYRVDGITTTDNDKKFNSSHLNKMGVNGLGLKIKSDFSTFVKYT